MIGDDNDVHHRCCHHQLFIYFFIEMMLFWVTRKKTFKNGFRVNVDFFGDGNGIKEIKFFKKSLFKKFEKNEKI